MGDCGAITNKLDTPLTATAFSTHTMTSTLPTNFILYMDNRKSQSDICSGLVHMTAEQHTEGTAGLTAYRLTQSPPALNQVFKIHFVPGSAIPYLEYPRSSFAIMNTENQLLYKRFVNLSSLFQATCPNDVPIPVYAMVSRTNIFKGIRLKRNIGFTILANTNVNPNVNTVANVNQPAIRKKNTGNLPTTSTFLAKQALELAVMKKETCPITMDEFSVNATAVMPCGHLFSTIAIAESFKSCMNQCPVCRVAGLATYV